MPARSRITSSRDVVSNTTPLITLAEVNLLDALPQLYQRIIIPPEVLREYEAGRQSHGTPDLTQLTWLSVRKVPIHPEVGPLDPGEAAAISLALKIKAPAILIDERLARKAAERLGLTVIGSLGVLATAKLRGIIPFLRPVIDLMLQQGRYLSRDLCNQVLRATGEPPLPGKS